MRLLEILPAYAAGLSMDIQGNRETKDFNLATSGVNYIVILGVGLPLHPSAYRVEVVDI